jgi:hypothetical protein
MAALASCFAAVRVRPGNRDCRRCAPRPEECWLIEWPQVEIEPTKYWQSILPEDTELASGTSKMPQAPKSTGIHNRQGPRQIGPSLS